MKKISLIAASAIIACTLTGCKTAQNDTLRAGTYNIRLITDLTPNSWEERREDLVDLIRDMDLDVFGLQEVTPQQAAYLRNELTEFHFVGDHRGKDRKSDEASPVFYRKSMFTHEKAGTFWLSETPDTPGLKGWDAACPRVCSYLVLREKSTGRRFCFANTHTDHRSALARENGMLLVIERMKEFGKGSPIIFVGDHNCTENEKPALAVSAILNDALRVSETKPRGSWRTFNGWRWREKEITSADSLDLPVADRNSPEYRRFCRGQRIDYVYVSKDIKVLDIETVNASRPGKKLYPSDHFPVITTLRLPTP